MGEQTDKKTNHWDGNTSSIIIIIKKNLQEKTFDFWGCYNHHWRDQEHYYKDMKLSSGTSTLDVGFMTNS